MTLDDALRLVRSGSGETTWAWEVPDGWQQGRAIFGGLTLAALARAASQAVGSDRPLRTLTAEIPGAVLPGPGRIEVERLREGSSLSSVATRLVQADGVAAHAVFNFGRTRDVGFDRAQAGPPVPAFADVPPTPPWPGGATFTRHLEYRFTKGLPMSGAQEPVVEGWLRILEPGDLPPQVAILVMIDAWFPSVLPVFTGPRPFGTISFAAHVFDRGWRPGQPLFHRARLLGSQQGYFAELRELFDERGELCAVNQQTMAIIK